MFNQEFSNQELNDEQLDMLVEGQSVELSDEELDDVDGGYWYYNPYAVLNSANWLSTQVLMNSAAAGFQARDAQHAAFMSTF